MLSKNSTYIQNYLNKAKAQSSNPSERSAFIKWKYPTNILSMKGKKIRILPQNNENKSWFFVHKTHSFKSGGMRKFAICTHSEGWDGKQWGKCPICEFIKDRGRDIGTDAWKNLVNRDSIAMLGYCYDDNTIYMVGVFNSMFENLILPAFCDLSEDEQLQIEKEGFELYFKEDENGNPTFRKITVEDIPTLSELNLELEKLPDVANEIKPKNMGKYQEYLYSMLELGVKTFVDNDYDLDEYRPSTKDSSPKKSADNEDDEESRPSKKSVRSDDDDDDMPPKKSKHHIDEDDDEDDTPPKKSSKKSYDDDDDSIKSKKSREAAWDDLYESLK